MCIENICASIDKLARGCGIRIRSGDGRLALLYWAKRAVAMSGHRPGHTSGFQSGKCHSCHGMQRLWLHGVEGTYEASQTASNYRHDTRALCELSCPEK